MKRAIDFILGSAVYILSLPIQALVSLAIIFTLGRPVLFRQDRPGLNGEVFTLVKFRTMKRALPNQGVSSDRQRLTRFGHFLRATSLDELPTLANVIKGDMSLVGPRPLLVDYLDRYTPTQARRHEVRPGVTGLAQVNGRNAISWEEKFALDVEYVDARSFRLDLQILWRTVAGVLLRKDIAAAGQATTQEFMGSVKAEETR